MIKKTAIAIIIALLVSGCSTRMKRSHSQYSGSSQTSHKANTHTASQPSKDNYKHPTMRPYTVFGKRYYPTVVHVGEEFEGIASWYGPNFNGKPTSNGEIYDMYAKTAAHKTLPMNTIVRVTNRSNGKQTIVRINDRGPFVNSRIIDLSNTAAHEIDMVGKGTAPVTLEVLGFQQKGKKKIPTTKELKKGPSEQVMGSFAIQIASFSKIEGAIKTQEKYNKTEGYTTIIKDTEYNNVRLFRVWLTGFKSEQEARDFISNGPFQNSFIVRE